MCPNLGMIGGLAPDVASPLASGTGLREVPAMLRVRTRPEYPTKGPVWGSVNENPDGETTICESLI